MSDYKIQSSDYSSLNKNIKIIFVVSEFNRQFTKALEDINEKFLLSNGFENIEKYIVPGALEIPAQIKRMVEIKAPALVIALGTVIRGETTHYEIVSNESAKGIMKLSIDFAINTDIINGILTCENEVQVKARISDVYAKSGLNLLIERQKI